MLRLFTPGVWHPNVSRELPLICIGRLTPGTTLVDILYQLFDILTFQKYNPRENDSLNKTACAWARENAAPLSHRPPAAETPAAESGGATLMRLANETAATVFCGLNKCSDVVEPDGPWRWQCIVQNGTRLPIAASLEEGFLHLACQPEAIRKSTCTLERALWETTRWPGA